MARQQDKKSSSGKRPSRLETIRNLVKNSSYESMEVVGRGTLYVDVDEVLQNDKLRDKIKRLNEVLSKQGI